MKFKRFVLNFFYFYLFVYSIFSLGLFNKSSNQKIFGQVDKININQSIYYIKYDNRYYYYDIYDTIIFISDYPEPKFIEVVFSEEKNHLDEELNFIKSIYWESLVMKVDFQKKEIICYNNINIHYVGLPDANDFLKAVKNFDQLHSGKYFISNEKLFNIDDRGL